MKRMILLGYYISFGVSDESRSSAASDTRTLGKSGKPGLRLFEVFCLALNILLYPKYHAIIGLIYQVSKINCYDYRQQKQEKSWILRLGAEIGSSPWANAITIYSKFYKCFWGCYPNDGCQLLQ